MAEARSHGKILVIDDHYGVVSEDFYSREDFEHDYGSLPFKFIFSSAWDEKSGQYTVEAARRTFEACKPDCVLLDIVFDQCSPSGQLGLAILRELTVRFPEKPVVMMTVLARDKVWNECARLGAVDYLPKPLDARLLCQTLDRYIGLDPERWLIGQNQLFIEALNLAAMAAEGGQIPIMILGETGTGKGLMARFAHRHGRRADRPFDLIDLANIPPDHQAANLFGYRRGAFTGADRDEPGRFLAADGGVVFLDEIGDIDEGTQLRLLRVADNGEISRLGDGKAARVDVQIISATNADLPDKIKSKQFRYDLWARLNGMPVNLPSIAQRRDDIPLLVRHLLRCQALSRGVSVPIVPEQFEEHLMAFPWDGNVRGLRGFAQRVFDFAGGNEPNESHFLAALSSFQAGVVHPSRTSTWPVSDKWTDRGAAFGSVNSDIEPPLAASTLQQISKELRRLRLEELALLQRALDVSRDPVSQSANRAKAAALLMGQTKCSTNVFTRWLLGLWDKLDEEGQRMAMARYPELSEIVDTITTKKNRTREK